MAIRGTPGKCQSLEGRPPTLWSEDDECGNRVVLTHTLSNMEGYFKMANTLSVSDDRGGLGTCHGFCGLDATAAGEAQDVDFEIEEGTGSPKECGVLECWLQGAESYGSGLCADL